MRQVVIFGAGSWARLVHYYIQSITDWNVVAFTDDQKSCEINLFEGLPLISYKTIKEVFPPDKYDMIMGIGYREMSSIRRAIYEDAKGKGYYFPSLIHNTAILNGVQLGEGNFIMENVVFEPFSTVGENNTFLTSVVIGHDNIIGSHNYISINACVAGDVKIGNNCFLGVNSTIRNGVSIGDYTLVGAGAYVSENTQSGEVLVPARSVVLEGKKSIEML